MGTDTYAQKLLRWLAVFFALAVLIIGVTDTGRRAALGGFRILSELWQNASSAVSERWSGLFGLEAETGVMSEEDELQYHSLLLQQQAFEAVRDENRQLRAMMEVEAPVDWSALRATVVMRDPAVWNWEFWIDRGTRDGVCEGNSVLYGRYLAGRVVSAERSTARVVTLASPECRFGVYVHGSDGFTYPALFQGSGKLGGSQKPCCVVDFIDKDARLKAGDLVVSSGLGGTMPPEIPVASLLADALGKGAHLVDDSRFAADARPFAELRNCAFVTVFIPSRNSSAGNFQNHE